MSDQRKGGAEDEGKEDGRVSAEADWLRKMRKYLRETTLEKSDHKDAGISFRKKVYKWWLILKQAKGMAKINTNAYFALCDICSLICADLMDIVIPIPSDHEKVTETIAKYHAFIDDVTHYASCSELRQLRFAVKDGRTVKERESQFLERLSQLEKHMLFALYCMPDSVSGSKMWQVQDKLLQDSLLCMCNTKYFLGCAGTVSVFELLHFQKPEVLKVVADGEVDHVRVQDDVARQYQQLVGETRLREKS